MKLAPIGISTYSRVNHLRKTIKALQKNNLAKDSEVYIFSDAPKVGDEKIVAKVRSYLHTIDGFKKVHIIERDTNNRVANNRGGLQQLLDQYGKIIFLEEDIVTAPGFLQFMNDALVKYEYDERVLSITGYGLPIKIPENYAYDCFSLQRFNSWGFGIWYEKYKHINYFSKSEFNNFIYSKEKIRKLVRSAGNDMVHLLEKEANNEIDALDIKAIYYQINSNMFTIYPVKSLVQNIGHDGTGVHCKESTKYSHDELWSKRSNFKFIDTIEPDQRIIKSNYTFRDTGFKGKILAMTKKIGIYPVLKKIMCILE